MIAATPALLTNIEPASDPLGGPDAENVVDAARQRLGASSHYFLRTVACEFDDGVLSLRGRVPTFYLKQLAQSLVQRVDGVKRIVNMLDVTSPVGLA